MHHLMRRAEIRKTISSPLALWLSYYISDWLQSQEYTSWDWEVHQQLALHPASFRNQSLEDLMGKSASHSAQQRMASELSGIRLWPDLHDHVSRATLILDTIKTWQNSVPEHIEFWLCELFVEDLPSTQWRLSVFCTLQDEHWQPTSANANHELQLTFLPTHWGKFWGLSWHRETLHFNFVR